MFSILFIQRFPLTDDRTHKGLERFCSNVRRGCAKKVTENIYFHTLQNDVTVSTSWVSFYIHQHYEVGHQTRVEQRTEMDLVLQIPRMFVVFPQQAQLILSLTRNKVLL